MSLWEFAAAVDGYQKAHGGGPTTQPPTPEEFDAMKRAHGDA